MGAQRNPVEPEGASSAISDEPETGSPGEPGTKRGERELNLPQNLGQQRYGSAATPLDCTIQHVNVCLPDNAGPTRRHDPGSESAQAPGSQATGTATRSRRRADPTEAPYRRNRDMTAHRSTQNRPTHQPTTRVSCYRHGTHAGGITRTYHPHQSPHSLTYSTAQPHNDQHRPTPTQARTQSPTRAAIVLPIRQASNPRPEVACPTHGTEGATQIATLRSKDTAGRQRISPARSRRHTWASSADRERTGPTTTATACRHPIPRRVSTTATHSVPWPRRRIESNEDRPITLGRRRRPGGSVPGGHTRETECRTPGETPPGHTARNWRRRRRAGHFPNSTWWRKSVSGSVLPARDVSAAPDHQASPSGRRHPPRRPVARLAEWKHPRGPCPPYGGQSQLRRSNRPQSGGHQPQRRDAPIPPLPPPSTRTTALPRPAPRPSCRPHARRVIRAAPTPHRPSPNHPTTPPLTAIDPFGNALQFELSSCAVTPLKPRHAATPSEPSPTHDRTS